MNTLLEQEYSVKPNNEAELSVIGAILVQPELFAEIVLEVSANDFLNISLKNIFVACQQQFLEGKPIDSVTITQKLKSPEYREIIATAVQLVPSTRNWKSYTDIVKDVSKRKCSLDLALNFIEKVQFEDVELLDELAGNIKKILSGTASANTSNASQGFFDFYTQLQKKPSYQKTGLKKLDEFLYLEAGDYVVVGARPSVGKTAFSIQLMLNMATTYRTGFFTLETRREKIFNRAIGCFGKLSQSGLKQRKDIDFPNVANLSKGFSNLKLEVIDAAGWTVSQIQSKTIQAGYEIVFIDYLGIVNSGGTGRYEKVTNISIDLATMARSHGITVFALSQLNREGAGIPTLEDLRESGQIEQDADAVILLHSPNGNGQKERDLILSKNKEGQVGKIKMSFYGNIQRFYEEETRY